MVINLLKCDNCGKHFKKDYMYKIREEVPFFMSLFSEKKVVDRFICKKCVEMI